MCLSQQNFLCLLGFNPLHDLNSFTESSRQVRANQVTVMAMASHDGFRGFWVWNASLRGAGQLRLWECPE